MIDVDGPGLMSVMEEESEEDINSTHSLGIMLPASTVEHDSPPEVSASSQQAPPAAENIPDNKNAASKEEVLVSPFLSTRSPYQGPTRRRRGMGELPLPDN